jgi:hypothetical protein
VRAASANVWTSWSQKAFAYKNATGGTVRKSWLSTYSGFDDGVFPDIPGASGFAGTALSLNTYSLTNGANQGSSVSIGSNDDDAPFLTNNLCPITEQGFSLSFSFSISKPGSLNSLGNGLAISFVDASMNLPDFPRQMDQNGMLVPNAASVTLEIDTFDNACGGTPATPCTGAAAPRRAICRQQRRWQWRCRLLVGMRITCAHAHAPAPTRRCVDAV